VPFAAAAISSIEFFPSLAVVLHLQIALPRLPPEQVRQFVPSAAFDFAAVSRSSGGM